jgi:DNA-binding NarL/FixJ family response regulator
MSYLPKFLLLTPASQLAAAVALNSRSNILGAIMLKVLVIDDHTMVREGLRRLIARDQQICLIGEAGSKREAFAQISHLNPDVIVVDLNLPDGNGLEVVAWARSLSQRIGIVVLTMSNMPEHVLASMQSGASSHVDKASPSSELLSAIKASSVKPLSFTARKLTQAIDAKNREVGLTPRELEILEKLPTGDTVLEIAAQLFVTESTVKTHLASIYKKFGVKNRVQCINTARKIGLLP